MTKLGTQLSQKNYRVLNLNYNGVIDDYVTILKKLAPQIQAWIEPTQPVNWVGHSFGGILIRGLLDAHPDWQKSSGGRCVMLGSPNQGTQTASYMLSHWWLKYFVPKVTRDLTPDSELLNTLPEPTIETGIIAGNVDFNWLIPVSWYYKKATANAPGDGVVELSNTQCRSMTDFIVMPLHHSFMTWDTPLIQEVISFLEAGRFSDRFRAETQQAKQINHTLD